MLLSTENKLWKTCIGIACELPADTLVNPVSYEKKTTGIRSTVTKYLLPDLSSKLAGYKITLFFLV